MLINVSQSSQEDTTAAHADPQYNRYVNDMKAYFADVDAYEVRLYQPFPSPVLSKGRWTLSLSLSLLVMRFKLKK